MQGSKEDRGEEAEGLLGGRRAQVESRRLPSARSSVKTFAVISVTLICALVAWTASHSVTLLPRRESWQSQRLSRPHSVGEALLNADTELASTARGNLRPEIGYVTTLKARCVARSLSNNGQNGGGITNQHVNVINLLYLAKMLRRVPILCVGNARSTF